MEFSKPEIAGDLGVVRIADEVVSTVAGLAVSEIDGVVGTSGSWSSDLVEKLGRKNTGKGIKVEVNGEETSIDIFIVVEFGYPIPQVAENVQREVKMAVETMTGLTVTAINVNIVSVSMKKAAGEEVPAETDNE